MTLFCALLNSKVIPVLKRLLKVGILLKPESSAIAFIYLGCSFNN